MNSRISRIAAALAAVLILSACGGSSEQPSEPPLQGARIGGPFTLTDQNGKTVRDTDFAGKYRMVYFGYASCPDICPVDMQRNALVLQELAKTDPAVAAKIALIFVSVDPDRDTPAALKQFAGAFDPNMVALTGTPDAIAAVAKAYAVPFGKDEPEKPGGFYRVNHGTITYLMGPKGEPIAPLSREMKPDEMIAEIKKWVR